MRKQWFSDVKDLVKWGVIRLLVDELGSPARIVYVAMRTIDEKKYRDLLLETDRRIAPEIYQFFRGLERLRQLPLPEGVEFVPVLEEFVSRRREAYFARVEEHVESGEIRQVVFLDPDTGIEPPKTADKKHVLKEELRQVFRALKPGDILAVYQHKSRDRNWLDIAKRAVADATGAGRDEVRFFGGERLTKQLAIFVVRKSE